MEEDKAAAYYDELTRKGEGAARFKQGLGFSSAGDRSDALPDRGSGFPSSSSSSSFLTSFVRASSPTTASKFEKESDLKSIRDKLNKKSDNEAKLLVRNDRRDSSPTREGRVDRERERHSRRRSRSRDRYGGRESRSSRNMSRSPSPRQRERWSGRRRSSRSPTETRKFHGEGKEKRRSNAGLDYSRLIQGYENMSPAERVKAKMKLQLAETAEKDPTKGMGRGWERFDFDRDAPLDDEEIEDAGDDAAVVKHISQSFRFSAIEGKREERIKAAHDEAMFGAPSASLDVTTTGCEPKQENNKEDSNESGLAMSLMSEKVLVKQRGSWRERAHKG